MTTAATTTPVVSPLPPVDFRIAATQLGLASNGIDRIATSATTRINYPNDYGALVAVVRSLSDEGPLSAAVSQVRQAVDLLAASREDGADAFGAMAKTSVLAPLEKFALTWGGKTDLEESDVHIIRESSSDIVRAMSTISTALSARPEIAFPGAENA